MALTSIWLLRSSSPVTTSPRTTGAWPARLVASRSSRPSPAELGSSPALSAQVKASQSIAAVSVPWWMWPLKSSRPSQVACSMISPTAD